MTKTKKLQMELPKEGRSISSEFPILRENLNKIDQAIADVEEKTDNKAPLQHTHTISDVNGLETVLNGKMSADKTFTFADLSDIEGAEDAANNYVLYKSSNNNFTFGSAIALLGSHQHKTEDIVGLDEFRAKINEDLTNYGRLASSNEWKSYNKFMSKVTMSGGLELSNNSSFSLIHNNAVVTSLSTSGSTLKGPLKVDGKTLYTKDETDLALQETRNKINRDLTTYYGRLASSNEWESYNKFMSKVTMSGGLELSNNSSFSLIRNNAVVTSLSTSGSTLKGPLKVDGEAVYTKSQVDKLIASLVKKPVEILMTESGTIPLPDGVPDDTEIEIWAWGGGGGGGSGSSASGGGGGECARVQIRCLELKKAKTAIIASGGKGGTGNGFGQSGGSTGIPGIIWAWYGSAGNRNSGGYGGNGGNPIFGGGKGGTYGRNNNGEHSIFGGGGGGGGGDQGIYGGCGGNSSSGKGGKGMGNAQSGGGGGGGYFPGKDGGIYSGGDGGDGAILFRFFI